jgi:hypothetical protein
MTKTLSALQERMVARVLAYPALTLYLREGHVNSVNHLIKKELVDRHCYTMLQYGHLTPRIKEIFWTENGDAFAIEDIYDNCWLVFENKELMAAPRNETAAKRIVSALKLLRTASPEPICGACGQPWTGRPCGQIHNGHAVPVCYPSATEGQLSAA